MVEVNGKDAVLFTQTGEFIKFRSKEKVEIGQEYTYKKTDLKPLLIAASLLLCILLGSFVTIYNQVYASITVTINPQFKIDVNRFNRIINVVPLNKDAENILASVKLRNKNVDDGLILVIKKPKKRNI
ncbi:anti-sigma factor domain-containing protein [Caloramator sp. mosi_1]|uniref:anti-sigma factor domain-containing protein n=1 Tax=Caloramator sp. mosi_1 TaxID=3023090 RepID=UPI003FCE893A